MHPTIRTPQPRHKHSTQTKPPQANNKTTENKEQAQTQENTQQAKTNPNPRKPKNPGDNIVKYAVGYYGC
jgi:hypothetical protein